IRDRIARSWTTVGAAAVLSLEAQRRPWGWMVPEMVPETRCWGTAARERSGSANPYPYIEMEMGNDNDRQKRATGGTRCCTVMLGLDRWKLGVLVARHPVFVGSRKGVCRATAGEGGKLG